MAKELRNVAEVIIENTIESENSCRVSTVN